MMSEAKFTKGKWSAGITGSNHYAVFDKNGALVAVLGTGTDEDHSPTKNAKHNFHLIAASPDMYSRIEECNEVLQQAKDMLSLHQETEDMIDMCIALNTAALKKARGES